jgi:hypothetical protein
MLIYGCEAQQKQKILEAMEMWCYRRMMKAKWTKRITNEEILRVGEKRNIMNTFRRIRGRFIVHILRHRSQLKTVLEGEISGKKYRGRPRMEYIGQIMKDVKTKSYVGVKTLAENREEPNPVGLVARKLHLGGVVKEAPKLSLPGKLVFPSMHHSGHFSMLGLGDIYCMCMLTG